MSQLIIPSSNLQDNVSLTAEFSALNGGIIKLSSGIGEFFFAGERLWNLKLKTSSGSDFSIANTDAKLISIVKSNTQYTLAWKYGQLDVKVTVTLENRLSYWRIDVENHSDWILAEVDFPILGLNRTPAPEDYLVLPWQWGALIADPLNAVAHDDFVPCEWTGHERKVHQLAAEYPGIHAMQFMAYGMNDQGLYFGIHDGNANYKRFGIYGKKDSGLADLTLKNFPEKMTAPGVSYTMPYPAVIGIYQGDYFAAAKLYRQWAVKQEWCKKGKVSERTDIPQWVKGVGLWYWNWVFAQKRGDLDAVLPALLDLQKRIKGPLAFHWYGWNNQYHDTDYPEYKIDKQGEKRLREAVDTYHENNIKVFPYLNGRLWNIDTASWQTENAGEYACAKAETHKGEARRYYVEPYMNRPFVPMCPSTKFWQDKVIANVKRTLDYGLDGAYIDQISSAFAVLCHNRAHDHEVGGNYWYAGYRAMLENQRSLCRGQYPQSAFSSESVIECFIDCFDMYLGYQCALPATVLGENAVSIPLFSAVYHDYIPLYGTGTLLTQEDFFYGQALDITGGVMPSLQGYFADNVGHAEHDPKLEMLIDWCNKFDVVREALLSAELLGEIPCGGTIKNSIWRCPDGARILLAVNYSGEMQEAGFDFSGMCEVTSDGTKILVETMNHIKIPPYTVKVYTDKRCTA